MMQIGRKIYYELSTGNVIVDAGERQGAVVETTEDEDFQLYSALTPYNKSAVGCLQLNFGDYAQNFATYPYSIDISQNPPAIKWGTTPIGQDLASVQHAKIDQIRDIYNQTLASGFNVTIGTTQYTFGWQTADMTHMNSTQTAVSKGFLTFPIQYADVHGSPVTIPDQATLDNIESIATKFMMAQHQQALKLVGQIQSATTNDAVNAIQWTPGTY